MESTFHFPISLMNYEKRLNGKSNKEIRQLWNVTRVAEFVKVPPQIYKRYHVNTYCLSSSSYLVYQIAVKDTLTIIWVTKRIWKAIYTLTYYEYKKMTQCWLEWMWKYEKDTKIHCFGKVRQKLALNWKEWVSYSDIWSYEQFYLIKDVWLIVDNFSYLGILNKNIFE